MNSHTTADMSFVYSQPAERVRLAFVLPCVLPCLPGALAHHRDGTDSGAGATREKQRDDGNDGWSEYDYTKGIRSAERSAQAIKQYGFGPVQLTGALDALYDRDLFFDNVADLAMTGSRARCKAFARSVRDIPSQRWVRTEQNYERDNSKRVY
jgi:hypothetical protein